MSSIWAGFFLMPRTLIGVYKILLFTPFNNTEVVLALFTFHRGENWGTNHRADIKQDIKLGQV